MTRRLLALLFVTYSIANSQVNNQAAKRPLITQAIDEAQRFTLYGNTRQEASALNDRGLVADSLSMEHMMLQLKRSAEQESDLREFIDALHNPKSASFHHWLTPAQFGQRFGLGESDLQTVTGWLEAHGFAVNVVYPNKAVIDFSGTAGQVHEAFHSEIHNLNVNGEPHLANMSDPQIPLALSSAVRGIVSLHSFMPRPRSKPRADYTFTAGNSTYLAVVPSDLATIYNLNPLFQEGISGQGQTIALIEDTIIYKKADWHTFRERFGLSGYTEGTLQSIRPPSQGVNNCNDPGLVAGDDGEAILDAEWASAAAPNAHIVLAACANSITTFGGLIALQNLLNAKAPPPGVISISYGECEALNGESANSAYSAAYQQAVAEGVSVFVSAGDEGAASCDANLAKATHGIGVSGFASTPYNVAVGGTDFGDSFAGTNNDYWNAVNSSSYGSAKSYIPEIPWNDSCASVLIADYITGSPVTYGPDGFCNSPIGKQFYLSVAAGSGGPSGCATGSPSQTAVVSGSCQGYAKPSWQSGVIGIPDDEVRDIPDVSLFAANGVWGHYYVYCWSDIPNGGADCTGSPDTWSGAGGTSFSSPIMAGIQSLVNQKTGELQGNPNYVYYKLAGKEYGPHGNASCNSSKGNAANSGCTFYDVRLGDIDVNCTGKISCYDPGDKKGVLSTSDSAYKPAFGTTVGWDFATGLGTVNAYNLVKHWKE